MRHLVLFLKKCLKNFGKDFEYENLQKIFDFEEILI